MRVLVTGGAGFIGAHITGAYLAAGHELAVVDNLSRGSREAIPEAVSFYQADVIDQLAMRAIFAEVRPEVVNHHAALVSVRESQRRPEAYLRVNVQGTRSVLHAAQEAGARKLIFASSGGAIYGKAERTPIPESAPLRPISAYGLSKTEAERLLGELDGGLEVVVLRYGNVYGPGQDPAGGNGVIPIIAQALLTGRQPIIYGDGKQRRDFVYVADAARANLHVLNPGLRGAFNIGSGVGRPLREVYLRIARALGCDLEPAFLPANPYEVVDNVLDVTRAGAILGWQPQHSFADGLSHTLQWLITIQQASIPVE